ncbi:MAG: NADH-quinone oxidoreductase subunit K [Planctomycetota bacterium]
MTLTMVIVITVLFGVSVYLMLGGELKGIAMGLFLLSHAANLGILTMSGAPIVMGANGESIGKSAPVLAEGGTFADPLPQALILTAIVISFAVTAFLLTLLVTMHRKTGTMRVDALAELTHRHEPAEEAA